MKYFETKEMIREEIMHRLDIGKEWEDDEIAGIIDDVIL